jgi:predicted transcriptional regulator
MAMSQDAVLALLSEEPVTQKQLSQLLHTDIGTIGDRLDRLLRKGLIERKTLEIRYRPFGYVRRCEHQAESDRMRWPPIKMDGGE